MNGTMKRSDVRPCSCCRKGVAAAGPTFYTVQIGYHVLNPRGIQQTHGLEQFFGGGQTGAVFASIMGADPDLANQLSETPRLWVCLDCAMKPHLIAAIAEDAIRADEAAQAVERG